jgi:hypothetical protein
MTLKPMTVKPMTVKPMTVKPMTVKPTTAKPTRQSIAQVISNNESQHGQVFPLLKYSLENRQAEEEEAEWISEWTSLHGKLSNINPSTSKKTLLTHSITKPRLNPNPNQIVDIEISEIPVVTIQEFALEENLRHQSRDENIFQPTRAQLWLMQNHQSQVWREYM